CSSPRAGLAAKATRRGLERSAASSLASEDSTKARRPLGAMRSSCGMRRIVHRFAGARGPYSGYCLSPGGDRQADRSADARVRGTRPLARYFARRADHNAPTFAKPCPRRSPRAMKDETPAPQPRLLRALGPLMATAVVVGTVIGSGVFKKPQDVADKVPYFGLAALVWVLGGLLALLGGLALAEIAVLYPRAGGNYVFLREGYGRPFGFLWGWVEFWIIRSASIAALASIFSEQFHTVLRETIAVTPGADVLGFWPQQGLTVAVIVALALVNVRGVRWGGGLQLVVTTVKVASLLAILALPFIVWSFVSPDKAPRLCSENFQTSWPSADKLGFGLLGLVGSALVSVLWAYHGWMNIAPVAEEVRNPQRNIPLALLSGVGIIITLYLGANLAYYLVIPQAEMTQMKESAAAPAADGSEPAVGQDRTVAIGCSGRLVGPMGVAVAGAAVAMSVFGALNGNLLVGPRLLYAMGQDGLAPRALATVHAVYRTPVLATLVLAAWSCILVLAGAALSR